VGEPGDLDLAALRRLLSAARARGESFDQAWADAVAALVLDEPENTSERRGLTSQDIIESTRSAWRDAFERRTPQGDACAIAGLAAVLYEPTDERDRLLDG
jgi:hypothetical protein